MKAMVEQGAVNKQPVKIKKIVEHLVLKYCPVCKKVISARPPGVLAKCLLR
jgi:hypothetical protein